MKIQTLNKTQQKRLLSLCKEFFPEEKNLYFSELEENLQSLVFSSKGINNKKLIHWYQLCLTELPKRIWRNLWTEDDRDKLCTTWVDDEIIEGSFDGNPIPNQMVNKIVNPHPVDFLWDFVQECKKNKYFKNGNNN